MAFRFRRSFKILPGLKLNVTKKGLGLTLGGKAARVSINTSGDVTRSVGIPGTGLYWSERHDVTPEKSAGLDCPECGTHLRKKDNLCGSCGASREDIVAFYAQASESTEATESVEPAIH